MQGQFLVEKVTAPSWLTEILLQMETNAITEVNLSRKNIGDVYARSIVQALQKNTSVVSMDLSWNCLTAETAKSFMISLAKNSTLKILNLNSNAIDVDGAKAIAEGLKQNKGLICLKLSWNQLLDDGAKYFAASLTPAPSTISHTSSSASNSADTASHSTRTTVFSSAGNSSSAGSSAHSSSSSHSSSFGGANNGAHSAAIPYFSNSSLTSLDVACNSIRDDGAKALLAAVRVNPALIDLNLEWNEISDDSLRVSLPPLLQGNRIRSALLFSNDQLSSDGIKSIAASMNGNQSLQSLSLSGKFGDTGAKYIASALTRHHLLHLYLNKSKIGDEGVRYLCTALMTNKFLKTLHLSTNKIGNEGAKAIQLLLEVNAVLTEIDLSGNRIGDSGVMCIATALTTNFTVEVLNLQQNEFSEGGRRAMEGALVSNWSLVELKGMVSDRLLTATKRRNRTTVFDNIHTSLGLSEWPGAAVTLVPPNSTPVSTPQPQNGPPVPANFLVPKHSFDRMVTLVLHNNQLTQIPSTFSQLKSLKALVLSRNRLVSPLAPVLGSLTSLTNLDLRGNLLESLPTEMGSLKSLTKLNASYNRLLTLPPSIGACTNLREVFLFENKLDVLPSQMARLYELKILDLRYNPLKFVLENVFPSKTHFLSNRAQVEKLFSYLTSLGEGEPTVLSRVKLMLVGDANVGKTSLRKYLAAGEKAQSGGSASNVTTDGIEISDILTSKKIGSSSSSSSSVGVSSSGSAAPIQTTFTTYDFAGQELYYTTHQFFLSDKAIYLVVFNLAELVYASAATAVKALANIEYWLKSIRVRAKYAPIVLVGTHLDEVGRDRADDCFTKLKTTFKIYRIEELFAVSTVKAGRTVTVDASVAGNNASLPNFEPSSKYNFATFSSTNKDKSIDLIPFLCGVAERRRLVGQTVPHSVGQLIHYIEEFRRNNWTPLMRFEDFKKVIVGYNTMDVTGTLGLLTSMGFCLYFENDLNLRDVVVLNPQALANLMSAVITLKYDHVRDGKLRWEDFAQVHLSAAKSETSTRAQSVILSPTALQDQIHKLLFLLEKFEVLFRLPNHLTQTSAQLAIATSTSSMWTNKNAIPSHVLVPCMLPAQPPHSFLEVQRESQNFARNSRLLFARTYKFQFMPFGFFSRLMVRILNIGAQTVCWGLWRDGLCIREVSGNSASEKSEKKFESEYGCIQYDPKTYRLLILVVCSKNGNNPSQQQPMLYPFLDRLIRAIDSLIDVFYAKEKEGMLLENKSFVEISVSCVHCLRLGNEKPTQFALSELIQAFMNDEDVTCTAKNEKVEVPISEMIPDLILSHLPFIEANDLKELTPIGEGGFATVYQGMWKGVPVAVKELKVSEDQTLNSPSNSSETLDIAMGDSGMSPGGKKNLNSNPYSNQLDEAGIARFKLFHHEVFMMSAFDHPNLVRLYGIATAPFRIVMEYVPGSTLTDVIYRTDQYPDISWRMKVEIALDIARGMCCLHSAQPPVVHRDLRPQNIFVQSMSETAPVHVKVGDFGLAQHVFSADLKQFLGSFFWLAPEVLAGDSAYSLKSDVYSFAMVFWEIITRKTPFSEFEEYLTTREQILTAAELADKTRLDTFRSMGYQIRGNKIVLEEFRKQDVVEAILSRNLRPSIPKEVPSAIKELISACWGPVINARPDFSSVVALLEGHLKTLPPPSRSTSEVTRPPSRSQGGWQKGSATAAVIKNSNSPRHSKSAQLLTVTPPTTSPSLPSATNHANSLPNAVSTAGVSPLMDSVIPAEDVHLHDEDDDGAMSGWVDHSIENMREELELEFDRDYANEHENPTLTFATSSPPSATLDSSITPSFPLAIANTGAMKEAAAQDENSGESRTTPRGGDSAPFNRARTTQSSVPVALRAQPKSEPASAGVSPISSPAPSVVLPARPSSPKHPAPSLPTTSNTTDSANAGQTGTFASRPKRPPPQPLMSQQRATARSLVNGELPSIARTDRSAQTASQTSNVFSAKASAAPSQSLPSPGNSSSDPQITMPPKAAAKRSPLQRSVTTTPKTVAMQASASYGAIDASTTKPAPSAEIPIREAPKTIPIENGPSQSPSPLPPNRPKFVADSAIPKGRTASPSASTLRNSRSPSFGLETSPTPTRPSSAQRPLKENPPRLPSSRSPITSRTQSSVAIVESSPTVTRESQRSDMALQGFSKALEQAQLASNALASPVDGTNSPANSSARSITPTSAKRALTLPAIIHVWNKDAPRAACLSKVSSTNELWIASMNSTLHMCDNAVNDTGTLSIIDCQGTTMPAKGTKGPLVVAMAATEEHVWTALDDGKVLLWDPLDRSLRSSLDMTATIDHENKSVTGASSLTVSPITALYATPMPGDTMSVCTAHDNGVIRHWVHCELETSFSLAAGSYVTCITHTQPTSFDNAPTTPKNKVSSTSSTSYATLRSHRPQRLSSTIGSSIWFAIATKPNPQVKKSLGCQIMVTDGNLQPISSFSAHTNSPRIYNLIAVGNKVWSCGEDGIMVWNATSCELEKTLVPPPVPRANPSSPTSSSHSSTAISSLLIVSNPLQTADAQIANPLVWAFSPHNMLYVYDSVTLACVRYMALSQLPPEDAITSAFTIAKDRVLTVSNRGLLSLWGFQKPDRLSRHIVGSPGSSKIVSNLSPGSSPRRPIRQAPTFPNHAFEFK